LRIIVQHADGLHTQARIGLILHGGKEQGSNALIIQATRHRALTSLVQHNTHFAVGTRLHIPDLRRTRIRDGHRSVAEIHRSRDEEADR